ncbi:uncharacterized protein LOC124273317 [Haliotis rubra]|uniref:uncharacterized protein LOC124273317 n=1 Tax=Haliotis rubra TaxID=36100 RepID=UPI001EE56A58|nr:uncharacterized protein LOC124273317 [Haliotis rubra]
MTKEIENHVSQCYKCIRRKRGTTVKAQPVSIKTTQPLELVCMDFLTLEPSNGGQQCILVVTDHFTRYAQAYPTKKMTAQTTAEVFFKNFVVNYGLPKRIHSDQEANFQENLMKDLCNLTQIDQSRTTPYNAMGNGQCERFNRALLNMLGTLDASEKKDWKSHVGPLMRTCNSTRHETTGYSPFFLMFGRQPRLPVDLAFGLDIEPSKANSLLEYTISLKDRLKQAYELAAESATKSQARQKANYDIKARAAMLDIGDRVLVKIVAFDWKHKIADKWEKDVYVILHQPDPAIPVFVVGKERDDGKRRSLHRNLLLPIGSLPQAVPGAPVPIPRSRKSKTPVAPSGSSIQEQEDLGQDQEDDSEDEICFVPVTSPEPSVSAGVPADRPPESEAEVVTDAALHEDHRDEEPERATDVDGDEVGDIPGDEAVSAPEDMQIEAEVPGSSVPPVKLSKGVDAAAQEDVHTEVETSEPPPTRTTPEGKPRRRILPTPPLRRSQRERQKPSWQTSGKYVMAARTTPKPDWISRADYLSSLIATGVVASKCDKA